MLNYWPHLSYEDAKDTYQTLHLWTQIVGKIKLAKMPWINHSWQVTLSVTSTGLTTSTIGDNNQHFQIDFDFINHLLYITTFQGESHQFELRGLSVAGFYNSLLKALSGLKIEAYINPVPNEIRDAIPFPQDTVHHTYNTEYASNLHKALLQAQCVFQQFRAGFKGKCSPVHFFWGGFDLAVSRFSGRKAPKHPGGVPNLPDWVAQEAYSHEVSSCGFWPGNDMLPYAAFYAYMYPEPSEYNKAVIEPKEAFYHETLREFILPYNAVQQSQNPDILVLRFLQTTYNAGADLAQWDRAALEEG